MIDLPILECASACAGDLRTADAAGPTLIVALLAEQQSLSAVDEFSRWCQGGANGQVRQAPANYRALLPSAPPRPGQQFAFEVDLDRCSGCKACVTACHALNGLDEAETWRDVGLLIGGSRSAPVVQHVTAACHHCLKPACLIACPVNAYEKDPLTGIVRHLDDQCFGCQYCTMACPYDVPKYRPDKGIVRKCDMCSSRLAAGEPPACVQACPHAAINIRLVDSQQVIEDAETALFLPAAPNPQLTLPTTSYKTRRALPRNLLPADYFRVNPQHAHWPLVWMLVLTQMSVGGFVAGLLFDRLFHGAAEAHLRSIHAVTSLALGLLALASSLFHLGRPQYAFRAVLGLRHSWLSREIVAFGAFAFLASLYALLAPTARSSSLVQDGATGLGWSVAASGGAGVFCSVMIYVFTRRECWSFSRVAMRFALSAALLGVSAAWMSILIATVLFPSDDLLTVARQGGPLLGAVLAAISALKLAWEAAIFRHLLTGRMTPLRRSALLLTRELSSVALARFALGLLGGIVMPLLLLNVLPSLSIGNTVQFAAMTVLLFLASLLGELLERYLFFAACAAPRMPGGIR